MTLRLMCGALLFLGACDGGGPAPSMPGPGASPPLPLMAMPPDALAKCRRIEQLRPACPADVPEVDSPDASRSHSSDREPGATTFFVEWSAPHPGLTKKNAPPRFAHVNVLAGDLQVMAGFHVGGSLDGPPGRRRSRALSLGAREWNGRAGELLLAPSYPQGGMEGDHLIFRWAEDGTDYSISLHAWEPLETVEGMLKAMVGSLP